jgi:DNA-binding NarL/FixJ family response regulator
MIAPTYASPEGLEKKKPAVRILIAEDHPIVRDALKKLLLLEDDFDVVGEAADGREVLDKVQDLDPDVLLLDLRMPNLDGLSALQALQQSNQRTRVIVLTASEDKNDFVQAMKLGCRGIVLKQTAPDLIVKSIRKVNAGEMWLDSRTTAAVMRQFHTGWEKRGEGQAVGKGRERSDLSSREREIVALVAQGYRNKEMAEKMFISEQTVKNHLHNIFDKLGVSDRLELALYAIHKGLHLTNEGANRQERFTTAIGVKNGVRLRAPKAIKAQIRLTGERKGYPPKGSPEHLYRIAGHEAGARR